MWKSCQGCTPRDMVKDCETHQGSHFVTSSLAYEAVLPTRAASGRIFWYLEVITQYSFSINSRQPNVFHDDICIHIIHNKRRDSATVHTRMLATSSIASPSSIRRQLARSRPTTARRCGCCGDARSSLVITYRDVKRGDHYLTQPWTPRREFDNPATVGRRAAESVGACISHTHAILSTSRRRSRQGEGCTCRGMGPRMLGVCEGEEQGAEGRGRRAGAGLGVVGTLWGLRTTTR
ncbi:hypothetical protein LXA43DRAFT_748246 [Ganoderma leucocontextum]|nr:hypothetical protein LXA43DRAFT_748246 [Ganoderma leucocontextum]